MKQLVDEREKNGIFTSFQDFCERMYDRELNRRALESLIKAGSFDSDGLPPQPAAARRRPGGRCHRAEPQKEYRGTDGPVRHGQRRGAGHADRAARIFPRSPSASCSRWRRRRPDFICRGIRWTNTASLPQTAPGCARAQDHRRPSGESAQPVYRDGMTVRLACVVTAVKSQERRKTVR